MAFAREYTRTYPSSSFGYYLGAPMWQGSGSGMGPKQQGAGMLAQGTGSQGTAGGWHPTILYLLLFVLAEMVVFGLIARILK